jgi:glycerol-3-phosphate cytidylyltransferase
MIIGYTSGVFDLFHAGHLNLLEKSKSMCDKLIVGVTTDEYCIEYKNKAPIIKYNDRSRIINSLKCVDIVIPQENHDKFNTWEKIKFDIMFVGDDWFKTEKWEKYDKQFKNVNVKIIYFPRTPDISSSELSIKIANI